MEDYSPPKEISFTMYIPVPTLLPMLGAIKTLGCLYVFDIA
jgi:hypothetical protein